MQLINQPLRLIIALILTGQIFACTQVPDLGPIKASFSGDHPGSGVTRPSAELTKSDFGARIRAAVETSPVLAQSESSIAVATANQFAAEGAFLPQVSLGINARSERIKSDIADVSPYLRVSQLVYDGGAARGDLTAARARVLESRGNQLQTAAATALAAVETYVLVQDSRRILKITAQNVAAHEDLVHQISSRTASGAGSNADVLTARSRMANSRTRLADAKTRVDRAEARFREVFGTPAGVLSDPVPAPKLERSDSQIVLESPQVRRADAGLVAAKAEWAAAQARRQPDIRVAAFANQDDRHDANFGVDLAFNYEIDSTGQRRAAVAAAEARVNEAAFARETLVREIGRELAFIRSDQKAGAERLRAARSAARANSESLEATRAQFTIGRRSLIEILDAQLDYVDAQERLILSEQNFFLTNYAALSLTGDILGLLGISLTKWEEAQ